LRQRGICKTKHRKRYECSTQHGHILPSIFPEAALF
jgi:hypothetical protein